MIYFICVIVLLIRWCVYHLEWEKSDGAGTRKMSKVAFISFAPDNCADNSGKFIVAANKGMLTQKMKPNRDFQINNWDDLVEENLQKVFT